jgi:hypothetical protein
MKETPNSTNNHPVEVAPAAVELREQIEKRAYHLWLSGGGGHGDHLRHWLQAEGEVLKSIKQEKLQREVTRKTRPTAKPRSAAFSNDAITNK